MPYYDGELGSIYLVVFLLAVNIVIPIALIFVIRKSIVGRQFKSFWRSAILIAAFCLFIGMSWSSLAGYFYIFRDTATLADKTIICQVLCGDIILAGIATIILGVIVIKRALAKVK